MTYRRALNNIVTFDEMRGLRARLMKNNGLARFCRQFFGCLKIAVCKVFRTKELRAHRSSRRALQFVGPFADSGSVASLKLNRPREDRTSPMRGPAHALFARA